MGSSGALSSGCQAVVECPPPACGSSLPHCGVLVGALIFRGMQALDLSVALGPATRGFVQHASKAGRPSPIPVGMEKPCSKKGSHIKMLR